MQKTVNQKESDRAIKLGLMEGSNAAGITVNVKFSGRSIPVSISLDSSIGDLKSHLQPLTNVLPRGQKLIFKGKLLADDMTLRASEVTNGAKIMLMCTQGLHQGDGPITRETLASSGLKKTPDLQTTKNEISVQKNQFGRWKATGVFALSEHNLKTIPAEIWTDGTNARVLDLSRNLLQDVPIAISSLSSLQKLFLNGNNLADNSISWEGIASLKSLTDLNLSLNHLTCLPPTLGVLTSLKQLNVANNNITSLPSEIGLLVKLEILMVNNNRLSTIPTCIGNCISLVEVDISSNLLTELPDTFGNLHNLKALSIGNNGLKSLPTTLFKMCKQLSSLDIHGTEITLDLLRQFEGWEQFDERRRLKYQKQLDFRVGGSAEFDEGADKN